MYNLLLIFENFEEADQGLEMGECDTRQVSVALNVHYFGKF